MTDEVAAAKEAAANYKSSDGDGAGPATVFDKLLRYVQQSPITCAIQVPGVSYFIYILHP